MWGRDMRLALAGKKKKWKSAMPPCPDTHWGTCNLHLTMITHAGQVHWLAKSQIWASHLLPIRYIHFIKLFRTLLQKLISLTLDIWLLWKLDIISLLSHAEFCSFSTQRQKFPKNLGKYLETELDNCTFQSYLNGLDRCLCLTVKFNK